MSLLDQLFLQPLACQSQFLLSDLSPPVRYFTDHSKAVLLLWIFYFFSVLGMLCICLRLFICALWPPAGKGLTSWLSFVMSNCEFVTFPLVSWVSTWLYQFLIFAPLLTLHCNSRKNYGGMSSFWIYEPLSCQHLILSENIICLSHLLPISRCTPDNFYHGNKQYES